MTAESPRITQPQLQSRPAAEPEPEPEPEPGLLPGPGGFLPSRSALPSPTPSTASSRAAARLPRPRTRPLVPGSRKEDYARDYVARRLLHISRRYVKKFGIPDPADEVTGYDNFPEVAADLEEVVDVLWFSGTPSLQVPYLLNVALAFNTYLPSFPPAPRPTFAFLRKMDHCFASLLVGYDVKTKAPLPGFTSAIDNSTKSRFSRTDMVRCKSLADETRMLVAMVMSGEVDVVDHPEDEAIVRRPARAETATQSAPTLYSNSVSRGPREAGTVKAEETDNDDPKHDFNSAKEECTTRLKRRADEILAGTAVPDEPMPAKRVKVEDEEDSTAHLGTIAPDNTNLSSTATNNPDDNKKGQFHWALEEDDDDDDDSNHEYQPDSTTSTKTLNAVPEGRVTSSAHSLDSNPIRVYSRGMDNIGVSGREDEPEEYEEDEEDEDEDEDEELQMNVGQVYEKTLVQLGQSLGESIIDD